MRRVLILGAGISGLSLAWRLRNQCEVIVAEASDRVGGWIRTHRHQGYLFEGGPHSFRKGEATLALIDELGLTPHLIAADTTDQYLYFRNRIQKVPKSLFSFLTSPLTYDLLPSLWREWRAAKGTGEESIQAFAERRFGSAVASRFFDSMVSGIFAGDPTKLSLQACFPQMYQTEQEQGSLVRKALFKAKSEGPSVFSLRGGLQQLTDTLAEHLAPRIQLGKEATKISFEKEVQVAFQDGTLLSIDHVYAAIPAWRLAKLLPIPQLTQIPFASVAAVSLGYRRRILAHKGFGYLVPAAENQSILGTIWDSEVFPQHNSHPEETRVTVMMGGVRRPDLVDRSDEELIDLARRTVSGAVPDVSLVTRARYAIPQYEVGFSHLLDQIQKACPPSCTLLGNSYYGVAINDCIQRSNQTETAILSP